MKRRRNRQLAQQRAILAILGITVGAGAVAGLLIAFGVLDQLTPWADGSAPLLNDGLDTSLESNAVRFQVAGLAVGVLLVVFGTSWLRHQIPPIRHQQDHEVPNASEIAGTNTIDGSALAGAIADDLERHPAVERAVVELRADSALVRLQISAADDLPLSELRSSVIAPALERASAVGAFDSELTAETDVRFIEAERIIA
jgi:ABC-type antimicrobial peptide transport system permease subunit